MVEETFLAEIANGRESDADMLSRILHERHSCRGFLSRRVPRPLIEQALQLAQRTASWCNLQPWQVMVTEQAATDRFRDALYAHACARGGEPDDDGPDIAFPIAYEGVYKDRRRACGRTYYRAIGLIPNDRAGSKLRMLDNFRFFGAPHVVIVTTERALGTYGAVDCGAFIANFGLAAHCLGFASVTQAAIAAYGEFVRRYFELPDNRHVLCGISFGFPDHEDPANAFRTGRADLSQWAAFRSE